MNFAVVVASRGLDGALDVRSRRSPSGESCTAPSSRIQCRLSRRSVARGRWLAARLRVLLSPRCERSAKTLTLRPEIRRDYPLNLSISISGGSETNQDSLSNGERSGNRPAPNPPPQRTAGTVVYRTAFGARRERPSPPDRGFTQRGCQACTALASASLCVLGVGLFGNAAQSGW